MREEREREKMDQERCSHQREYSEGEDDDDEEEEEEGKKHERKE